jgi:hypothetical protein
VIYARCVRYLDFCTPCYFATRRAISARISSRRARTCCTHPSGHAVVTTVRHASGIFAAFPSVMGGSLKDFIVAGIALLAAAPMSRRYGVLYGIPILVGERHPASEGRSGTESSQTLCWREMDSNFQYASTVRWHRATDLPLPPTVKRRSAGRPPPMARPRSEAQRGSVRPPPPCGPPIAKCGAPPPCLADAIQDGIGTTSPSLGAFSCVDCLGRVGAPVGVLRLRSFFIVSGDETPQFGAFSVRLIQRRNVVISQRRPRSTSDDKWLSNFIPA